ncbi:MAG: VanZ family protein [Anaerolineae bacterium]|nr:VanZ family protein [Anaerolineae bacterium]
MTLRRLALILDRPILRIGAAFLWTLIVLILTMLPGDAAVVGNASKAFGGTDVSDAVGHVLLAGILTLLYYAVAVLRRESHSALWIAAAGALILTTATELTQSFIPHRGASLLDLIANWLGVCSFILWMRVASLSRRAV